MGEAKQFECSFCYKKISGEPPGRVIAGAKVFICRNCVGIEVMAEADPKWARSKIEVLKRLSP